MKVPLNVKVVKRCAFCKYWYDPTNQHINPKSPKINLWEYENNARCKCLKRNNERRANELCPSYECKVPIM